MATSTSLHRRVAATVALIGLPLALAQTAKSPAAPPQRGGRLLVGAVDPSLRPLATAVIDELERKTLLSVVTGEATGVQIQATGQSPSPGALCCFDPAGGALAQRALAMSLLQVAGLQGDASALPAAAAQGGSGGSGGKASVPASSSIRPEEAELVNQLYAAEVLPRMTALPARVSVGTWQLVPGRTSAEWAEILEGRGRRVVAGAMRWACQLAQMGLLPGVVGALPTFIFYGNKAEVVLFGAQSAEVVSGGGSQEAGAEEAFGAGIQRAGLLARGRPDSPFVGGVPTYLGDGSLLLLRAAHAQSAVMPGVGERSSDILSEHRTAMTWSKASQWAQGHGALLGFPSFSPANRKDAKQSLEVIVVRGAGQVFRLDSGTPGRRPTAREAAPGERAQEGYSLGGTLALLWTTLGCCVLLWRLRDRPVRGMLSRAEMDLERLVSSL